MPIPERIETTRLVLRRPARCDAEAIFSGWASDPIATRYMSWLRHASLADSLAFIELSDREWNEHPAGPYVIELRSMPRLIGSCGFTFGEDGSAEVGYILACTEWGRGHATEALDAQVDASASSRIVLHAAVHPDNLASRHVLEKCGFACDDAHVLAPFPNLGDGCTERAVRYVRDAGSTAAGPTDVSSGRRKR